MIEENLGDALRQLRARQHLSLRTLAGRTGFSPSFLSQVENGQSSPSIPSIDRITRALGITLGQFFGSLEVRNTGALIEHAHLEWQKHWPDALVEHIGELGERGSLVAWTVTLNGGRGTCTPPHAMPFDNFAYVLEGGLVLTIDEVERHVLAQGNGIAIRAGRALRWENSMDSNSRVLFVCDVKGQPD